MAAVTSASTVLRPLPAGYTANVQAGTPLPGSDWTTLGMVALTALRPGFPQIAAFDLPSNVLPLPASLPGQSHFCSVVFVHSADDVYTATEQHVDLLTLGERKVAQKNLHIVQFVGTPPPPEATVGMWARLDLAGHLFDREGLIDLEFRLDRFPGRLLKAMELIAGRRPVEVEAGHISTLKQLRIAADTVHTMFLRIDPPPDAEVGATWEFSIVQRDAVTGAVQGGADYSVRINQPER